MTTTTWTGTNGNWTDPTWSDGVPDATLDAIIAGTSASPDTVTFNTPSGAAHSLDMTNATLAMAGGTLSLGSASTLDALTQSHGLLDFAAAGTVTGPISQTGGTLEDDSGTLALEGHATLDGTISGSGEIATYSTTAISGLTIGGGLTYVDAPFVDALGRNSPIIQTGLLTIGDDGEGASVVNNTDWTLTGPGAGIASGSAGSSFTNGTYADFNDAASGTASVSSVDFINHGVVVTGAPHGGGAIDKTLVFEGGTFTNTALVQSSFGDITFGPGEINTNMVGGTLTGGQWAPSGHTLALTGGPIATDAADIDFEGPGGEIEGGDGTTFTPIQQSLAKIAQHGLLALVQAPYSTSVALTDAGELDVNGSVFSDSAPLRVTATGTLIGNGTVAAPVTNFGSIVTEPGTFDFTGSLINHGVIYAQGDDEVDISGPHNVIDGHVDVQGELLFSGGSTTIAADAESYVRTVGLSAGATLVLERSVRAIKNFNDVADGGASTLDLDGHNGGVKYATFGGGALIDGGGTFTGLDTTLLGGLALDGGTTLVNGGTVTQSGSLTLGDSSGGTAAVVNNEGATWDITNAVSISAASATADTIANAGLFEMTGSGTATIGVAFTNTGTIEVTSGTLEITAPFTNTGTIIGTEIQSGGTTFITAPSATLFHQYAAAMEPAAASAPLVMPASLAGATMKLAAPHSG